MTDAPDPKTFDLIATLSGRAYPELEVRVQFNEALGVELDQVRKEIASAESRSETDKLEELDKRKDQLLKKLDPETFIIKLKSIPESVRRSIIGKVQDEFPEDTDLLGRAKPNPKADELFTKKMWQAYIREVTDPSGAVKVADEADINAIYANAPALVHEQITLGIQELQTGAKSGFEYAAKEVDFLSQASPEG